MHSIKQLEKQWKSYRLSFFIKRSIKVVSLYIGIAILYMGYLFSPQIMPFIKNLLEPNEKVTLLAETKIPQKHTDINESVSDKVVVLKPVELQKEKYEVALEPIIPIVTEQASTHKTSKKVHHSKAVVRAKPSTYLSKKELAVLNQSNFEPDSRRTKKINFRSSSTDYITTMKEKFKRSKQPREALLLAKAFYRISNFKKSEHWALVANKLNPNLDESWFLFAKSKAKLGKKKEAIKILASYYKKSHSSKARALISDIKRERI